jgi:hypothetical protein
LPVFSCDYNGWADVPEEEREGIEAFEATRLPARVTPAPPLVEATTSSFAPRRHPAGLTDLHRRAA